MDVTFFEQKPYYQAGIQGENETNEYHSWDITTYEPTLNQEPISHNQETLYNYSNPIQQDIALDPNNHSQPENHPQPELRVYSRRPKPQEGKVHESSDPSHEFNPGQSQNSLNSDELASIDDRPIALRKGKRSCTDHPIYNYVSYKNLSPSHFAFVSNLYKV